MIPLSHCPERHPLPAGTHFPEPDEKSSAASKDPQQTRNAWVVDGDADRRTSLDEWITAAGGRPHWIPPGSLPGFLGTTSVCGLVLLALDGGAGCDGSDLKRIDACKRAGWTVIAYADGSDQWSLPHKSRPLLAGAVRRLDSADPAFPKDLLQILKRSFDDVAEACREQFQIRQFMRRYGIVGECPPLLAAFRQALRFSQFSDLPMLVYGESGTGKELLARAIAGTDPKRNTGPFVAINCTAIQPNLLESEFFGHRRGAFTGADRDRKRWIRSADGGVLFLDEIGELDLGLQAKLLRVIQENRVRPVGEEHEIPVDVRFLAATNRDLERCVAEGRFRDDLYHRLRALVVQLPPLRDRTSDLPLLVSHFLQKHSPVSNGSPPSATFDFLNGLQVLDLPGNLRQLENIVRQCVLSRRGAGPVELSDLPPEWLR